MDSDSTPVVPSRPGEWSLAQTQDALSRKIPDSILKTRKQGRQEIKFLPWYRANLILDKYAPGWRWEIRSMQFSADRLFLVGRLTILTCDGEVWREATGTELLKEDKVIWLGEKPDQQSLKDEFGRDVTEPKEVAFGNPSSNAESMAFRRAAARFGLALYMYIK